MSSFPEIIPLFTTGLPLSSPLWLMTSPSPCVTSRFNTLSPHREISYYSQLLQTYKANNIKTKTLTLPKQEVIHKARVAIKKKRSEPFFLHLWEKPDSLSLCTLTSHPHMWSAQSKNNDRVSVLIIWSSIILMNNMISSLLCLQMFTLCTEKFTFTGPFNAWWSSALKMLEFNTAAANDYFPYWTLTLICLLFA